MREKYNPIGKRTINRWWYCKLLGSYKSRIKKDASLNVCADCGKTPHDVKHLFACPAHPTTLIPSDLWRKQMDSIREFSYLEAENLDWDKPRPEANNNNMSSTRTPTPAGVAAPILCCISRAPNQNIYYTGSLLLDLWSCEYQTWYWTLLKMPELFIYTRWMCGISLKDRRTNEELRRMVGVEPITTFMRGGRLRWYGHVMRTGWRNVWSIELKAEDQLED